MVVGYITHRRKCQNTQKKMYKDFTTQIFRKQSAMKH